MKFTPERARELMPIPKTMRPKIGGKTLYERIPIARKHPIAIRYDNRLYIGSVVTSEIIGMYECHPDAIPEAITPNGTVRELTFGKVFQIGAFEDMEFPNEADEEGGEE